MQIEYTSLNQSPPFKKGDIVELWIASTALRAEVHAVGEQDIDLIVTGSKNTADTSADWEPVSYKKKLSLFEMCVYCQAVERGGQA